MLKDAFFRTLLLLAVVCGLELSLIPLVGNDVALRIFGMRAGLVFLILVGVFLKSSVARYVGGTLLGISALVTLGPIFVNPNMPEGMIGIFVLSGALLSLVCLAHTSFCSRKRFLRALLSAKVKSVRYFAGPEPVIGPCVGWRFVTLLFAI